MLGSLQLLENSLKLFSELKSYLPVAQKRAEDHQTVFHQGHNVRRLGSFEEQLAAILEVWEGKHLRTPFRHYSLQLEVNVALLDGRNADIL